MPHAQGFDYYYGTLGVNNGSEVTLHRNNKEIGEQNNLAGQYPEKVTHLKEMLQSGEAKAQKPKKGN